MKFSENDNSSVLEFPAEIIVARSRQLSKAALQQKIWYVSLVVTGEFPTKGQRREALMYSLICAWINGWINNREAGELRRHGAHYDVTVMLMIWDAIVLIVTSF